MEIKLSEETLIGLKRLCNRSLVKEDVFDKLINDCSKAIRSDTEKNKSTLVEYKADAMKIAYAALVILLTEAARHDLDSFKLKTLLEGYNLDLARITSIVSAYDVQKINLQSQLSVIGTNLPHIVDIRWRLDYRIESDYSGDSVVQPYILVELVTVTSSNTTKILKFICTVQNLQELVFSLKGITRHLNKIVNPTK